MISNTELIIIISAVAGGIIILGLLYFLYKRYYFKKPTYYSSFDSYLKTLSLNDFRNSPEFHRFSSNIPLYKSDVSVDDYIYYNYPELHSEFVTGNIDPVKNPTTFDDDNY